MGSMGSLWTVVLLPAPRFGEEVFWREDWDLLCMAGFLHRYAYTSLTCRSSSVYIWHIYHVVKWTKVKWTFFRKSVYGVWHIYLLFKGGDRKYILIQSCFSLKGGGYFECLLIKHCLIRLLYMFCAYTAAKLHPYMATTQTPIERVRKGMVVYFREIWWGWASIWGHAKL